MAGQRPKGWKLLKAALATRKAATMLAFGFSSGLPFALLIGTLNAWLGDAKINLATIGVLSWIGLTTRSSFCGRRWSTAEAAAAWRAGPAQELDRAVPGVPDPVLRRARSNRSRDQHRLVRDLRGDRRFRLGDPGYRRRCLAHRCRGRKDTGRAALGRLSVRLSYRFDRRRRFCLVPRRADPMGQRLFRDGRAGAGDHDRRLYSARHPAPAARHHRAGARAAGRDQRLGQACRVGVVGVCWLWAILSLAIS